MEIDLQTVGQRIKDIRTTHHYSMAQFAKLVGNSSASTVNNWEKGNNLPKKARLEKIAILGNTTADWIKYGDFETFVAAVLHQANPTNQLAEPVFSSFITQLKQQHIAYDELAILTAAKDLIPAFFEVHYAPEQERPALVAEQPDAFSAVSIPKALVSFLPDLKQLLAESPDQQLNQKILRIAIAQIQQADTYEKKQALLAALKAYLPK